jgi:hypothetical protein
MLPVLEVRCCCDASLLGYLPEDAQFTKRELEDGSWAFDSNHNKELVEATPGFTPATENQIDAGKKETWKKTWKKH